MTEENPDNLSSTDNTNPDLQPYEPFEPISKTDAMAGVITEPGETYQSVAAAKGTNYWILPIVIMVVANLIASFLFLSNDELGMKVMNEQKQQGREKLDERVKNGELTREQADQSLEMSEKFMDPKGTFFSVIAYGGSVVGPFIILFGLSLIYLVVLKIFKAEFGFTGVLNVVGLGFIISAIGAIVTTVLCVVMNDVVTVSLGLVMKPETVGRDLSGFVSAFDLFSIWFYTVIAIGLSKLGKISFAKAAVSVFGIWIFWNVITKFVVSAMF